MNEEEKKALKVINTRTKRLLDELKIEKEDMSDEPRIAYLMQEIRANKTLLNLIEKLQKENEILKEEKAQAWEEWNNLEQGSYETEQRLKRENEEYKKAVNVVNKEKADWIRAYQEEKDKQFDLINKTLSNDYISKQRIKEIVDCWNNGDYIFGSEYLLQKLQELLEGRK